MRICLIPTKLETLAADLLTKRNYEVIQDPTTPLEEQAKIHPEAEVLIVRSENITPNIIDAFPKLKLIVRAGAGYNTIDIKYARRKGIDVMNTPGANANAVAEEVVGLILAAYRYIVPADISTRAGKWEKNKFMGRELTGKTVGIVGLGNIGRLLARLLSGFKCRILAYDPAISSELARQTGAELTDMKTLFKASDIISLHIPATPETKGSINAGLFAEMKTGAMLVNCARCEILNEADLRAAKAEKKLIFCNDVYPKDIEGEKSVADIADIMLPHLGASTKEANATAARRAAEQTIAYFDQGITQCVVNKAVPDSLDARYQQLSSIIARFAYAFIGGEKSQPHQLSITLYGKLNPFFDWLISPIANGHFPSFDPYQDAGDALSFLTGRGVQIHNREPDENKGYGESVTIDLLQGNSDIQKVSVRGTLTEGKFMIARINDFRNLYLEYSGNNLLVEYPDRPGMIGKIAGILGEAEINILDLRAPQDLKSNRSLAVIKTNVPVPASVQNALRSALTDARVVAVNFPA